MRALTDGLTGWIDLLGIPCITLETRGRVNLGYILLEMYFLLSFSSAFLLSYLTL